ncbi:MAG TPA: hypothetical protein VH917_01570, partial [Ignavibacteriaceae bacterium]
MSSLSIKTVKSKTDLNAFIKFPFEIYRGNNNWVPPLNMEQRNLLDRNKNPFFKNAEAEYFLAERDGKIVGRIAAVKNDLHLKYHNDESGQFGFFECINDQQVADLLFNTAKDWLRSKGLKYMNGPANPSSNDVYGMLIDGFDDPP